MNRQRQPLQSQPVPAPSASESLRHLAGVILIQAQNHPDDAALKKLSKYVTDLVMADGNTVQELLIRLAKAEKPEPPRNPFIDRMQAQSQPSNEQTIEQAKAILKQIEANNECGTGSKTDAVDSVTGAAI